MTLTSFWPSNECFLKRCTKKYVSLITSASMHIFLEENGKTGNEVLDLSQWLTLTVLMFEQKHYAEVSAKFCKFQRPVDFDPKLAHIKHVLEELEEQIHILDISSLEPEDLQTQLDHCMASIWNVMVTALVLRTTM